MTPADALQQLGYDENSESWITKDNADEFNSSLWRALESDIKKDQGIEVYGSYVFRTSAKNENGEALLAPRPAVHVVKAQNQEQAILIRKKLWNLGSAPFIIIILPERVLVYSGFDYDDKKQDGDAIYQPVLSSSEISKHLKSFYASEIDSGAIWITESKKLKPEKRVDQRLLVELKNLGKVLREQHKLEPEVAHALIGKFIYIWYLRERGILTDSWLKAEHLASWESITDREASATALKLLVEALEKCFNGKIFPLDFEALGDNADRTVQLVAGVFRGDDAISRQLALNFKIYDFSCIPVELLSSIYEQFLHAEGKGKDEGAVYTREFVADYLLAEINSVKPLQEGMRILDPACGSGVFLVLSYRRLIEIRLRKEKKEKLSPHELGAILEQSIYGVELIRDACYVTEFSLILMLLSYVDPPDLEKNKDFHFPELHNTNIIEGDFFNDELPIFKQKMKFDWIVGNPSWQKLESTSAARKQPYAWAWMQDSGNKKSRPVGDFSLSEAFSWRSVDVLNEDGYVGLLVHAMSLFNGTSKSYRRAFFKAHEVRRITNFANLRRVLFVGRAVAPGATIILTRAKEGTKKPSITHYAPFKVNQIFGKQERRSNNTAWSLTIYEDEIQTVEADDAESGEASVWKFAMWGSHRDRRLVARLENHFSKSLKQHDYLPRQGLKLLDGNTLSEIQKKQLKCSELDDIPRLDVKVIQGEFFLTAPQFAYSSVDESNRFIRKRSGKAGLRACLCSVGLGQTGVDETRIQSGLSQRLERRAMASGGACSS